MVIGYCGKVPRNTGIDPPMPSRKPGATEFTCKRTVQPPGCIADDDHQAAASSLI
jgi:hypothetical protein